MQRCQADPDANFEQGGWTVCLQMNPRFLSPIDTQRGRLPLQKTAPVDFLQPTGSPELAAALLKAARRLRFRKPDLRTRQHPSELIPKKSSGKRLLRLRADPCPPSARPADPAAFPYLAAGLLRLRARLLGSGALCLRAEQFAQV